MTPNLALPSRYRSDSARRFRDPYQRGTFLLEALIAVLIFAFGALGIAGLHARAVRHLNDAHYRGEALHIAHAAIARMIAADATTLYAEFDTRTGGAGYRALVEEAKKLPGVSATQNAPQILVSAGPSSGSRQVTVKVSWRAPGETLAHRYDTTAVVGRN